MGFEPTKGLNTPYLLSRKALSTELSHLSERKCNVPRYATIVNGAMAEWTKAAVLKTAGPQGSGGSNPSRSAGNVLNSVSEVLTM